MIEVYGGKDSYIIGLEKSRHGKKCLSGLSCSKMFPLQIRTALCLQLGNKLYTHYKKHCELKTRSNQNHQPD